MKKTPSSATKLSVRAEAAVLKAALGLTVVTRR